MGGFRRTGSGRQGSERQEINGRAGRKRTERSARLRREEAEQDGLPTFAASAPCERRTDDTVGQNACLHGNEFGTGRAGNFQKLQNMANSFW